MTRLHLLMNFPKWCNGRETPLDAFMAAFPFWAAQGKDYGLFLRHRPKREQELEGGSVYCRWEKMILWRMPINGFRPALDWSSEIGERWHRHTVVSLSCKFVLVRPTPVRFMRGFRYIQEADVPPDIPKVPELNPDLERELERLGVGP